MPGEKPEKKEKLSQKRREDIVSKYEKADLFTLMDHAILLDLMIQKRFSEDRVTEDEMAKLVKIFMPIYKKLGALQEEVYEEISSLRESIKKGEEREEQLAKVDSLEKKLDVAINDIITEMRRVIADPTKTKEYAEALSKLGMVKQEKWIKRNIVALVGTSLTFIAAVISIFVSAFT